jgi:hypothetical protein
MADLRDSRLRAAITLVEELLTKAGPRGVPAKEVIAAGEATGLTRYQLRTAREVLKATSEKETNVRHGRWIWRLPPGHIPFRLPSLEVGFASHPRIPAQRSSVPDHPPPVGMDYAVTEPRRSANPIIKQHYRASCFDCGRWTTTIFTREVEMRDTPDGEQYGVGDGETRYTRCDECNEVRLSAKRRDVQKRIASLTQTCAMLKSACPTDPNIYSCEVQIARLQRELQDYERSLTDA